MPRTMLLRCSSPEDVDARLTSCKAAANLDRVPVVATMHLDSPRNASCPFCDSGRKWKHCACSDENVFMLTFYPDGYRFPTQRDRRLSRGMSWAAVVGLTGLTLQ